MISQYKKSFLSGIFLCLGTALVIVACNKVHQAPVQPNTGRMLQVELKMPEPWKKIFIGQTDAIEYPNIRPCGTIETQQCNPVPQTVPC